MHMLEISAKLQNAEISPVTLLKSVSITDAHPTISKVLGTLTGIFCNGVSFNMVMVGGLNKSIRLRLLPMCRGELSTVIVRLMSKCL